MSWKLLGPFTHIEHTEVEFHVVEMMGPFTHIEHTEVEFHVVEIGGALARVPQQFEALFGGPFAEVLCHDLLRLQELVHFS